MRIGGSRVTFASHMGIQGFFDRGFCNTLALLWHDVNLLGVTDEGCNIRYGWGFGG
jgi:hypothetical protein